MQEHDILEELLASAEYAVGPDGKRRVTLDADDFELLLAEFRAEMEADARLLDEAIETDTEFVDYEVVRADLQRQGKL